MNEQTFGFVSNHIELLKGRVVIIYGSGLNAKNIIPVLTMFSVSMECIIDDDELQWENKLYGLAVKPPSDVLDNKADGRIILLTMTNSVSVAKKLQDRGLVSGVDFISVLKNTDIMGQNVARERVVNGVKVGRYSVPPYNNGFLNSAVVESIGSFCSINHSAMIVELHNKNYITTHSMMYSLKMFADGAINDDPQVMQALIEAYHDLNRQGGKVVIGNDVWIGAGVIIMPSVKIGDGAILGANSVITRDVSDYAIVIGSPARVINYRFSPEEINRLKKIRWWSWSEEDIAEKLPLFANKEAFFKAFD